MMSIKQLQPFVEDSTNRATNNLFSIAQYRDIISYLIDQQIAGKKVLDWGCGSGFFSIILEKLGADVSSFAIESYPGHVRLKGLTIGSPNEPVNLPYEDQHFNSVFSIGVLEHVREFDGDEIASINEIKRILKPGGTFVCYHFPRKYSWIELIVQYIWKKKKGHLYRYTKADIVRFAQATDMELVFFKRYALLPKNILSKLPQRIQQSTLLISFYYGLDYLLERILPFATQNNMFVLQKTSSR